MENEAVKKYTDIVVENVRPLWLKPNDDSPKIWDSLEFYKIALFVGVSVLGLFYPPLLFIHVMDYILNKEILANIFEAITIATKSLFYVSMLGVFFTIIFCTVTFSNYLPNVYEAIA